MVRKKILIIYPGNILPIIMASQNRVYDMVKSLSNFHDVHFMTFINNESERSTTINELSKICKRYQPIETINFNVTFIKKKVIGLRAYLHCLFYGYSYRNYYLGHNKILNQIKKYLAINRYDIIQIEYWYLYKIFEILPKGIIKVIDSHGILYDKKKLEYNHRYKKNIPTLKKRELNNYRSNEIKAIKSSDLFISISHSDNDHIKMNFRNNRSVLIHTGQDLSQFENIKIERNNKTILFYGGMDSKQNYNAVNRFIKYILPVVKHTIPEVKCRILGGSPPRNIKKMHDGKNFFVEGFVPDVRIPISKCSVMILPLDLGAGFRSRIVEVMAIGVPVVGTHNALDNTGLQHGKHCYISDDNDILSDYLIKLLNDEEQRKKMSDDGKNYVSNNFSIDHTYGTLSKYYSNL